MFGYEKERDAAAGSGLMERYAMDELGEKRDPRVDWGGNSLDLLFMYFSNLWDSTITDRSPWRL